MLPCPHNWYPCHQPRPKLVMNTCRDRNCWQAMRWGNMHQKRVRFSFKGKRGGLDGVFWNLVFSICFIWFHCVPHQVLKDHLFCSWLVLQVPNSSQLQHNFSLFFDKQIGKILESFVFLVQIRINLLFFGSNFAKFSIWKKLKKNTEHNR